MKILNEERVRNLRKLNIGCGADIRQDYINIDIRELPGVDIVMDLESEQLPFESNSIDEILAIDVLEHLSWRSVVRVLSEMFRVLKPGGILRLRVPDVDVIYLRSITNTNLDPLERFIYINFWLMGAQDCKENTHKTVFSKSTLRSLLQLVGFEVVELWWDGGTNIVAVARKPG
jgi:predicted SAM-dependent methyltransferase